MSSAEIAYSPVPLALSSIDESSLHQLKYHQLLKLASTHNVLKRWSKKGDLVKALLAVKSKNVPAIDNNSVATAEEWRDGKEVFNDTASSERRNSTEGGLTSSGRLTFVVEKDQLHDSRGTYNLTKTSFPGLALENIDSRLTFSIAKDPAPIFTQSVPLKGSGAKKLTVPMTTRNIHRVPPKLPVIKASPLKLSARSISIKKRDTPRSPMRAIKSIVADNNCSVRPTTPTPHGQSISKIAESSRNAKARMSCAPSRRKSKSDDPNAGRRSLPKATFHSPPTKKAVKDNSSKLPLKATNSTQVPRTKLPNFAALHQRQFEKMDSLDDYIHKKTERVKRLFGTPTKAANEENMSISTVSNYSPSVKKTYEATKRVVMKNTQLRTRTDVKDKNRSHIHGFRTNKRFELQMKFRNL